MSYNLTPARASALRRAQERGAAARVGGTHTESARRRIGDAQRGRPRTDAELLKYREVQMALPVLGECVYCGGAATTRDHVIPRGRAGSGDRGNLVLACVQCNASKGEHTPEEWLARGLYQWK